MAAREAAPGLPLGWLSRKIADEDWPRLEQLGAVSIHTNHTRLDPPDVLRLKSAGYRVMVYTVNEAETAQRLFDLGVDGLFTDNLREFAAKFPALI